MYAVVQIGNSQYKVAEGDTINTHRLSEELGKKVTFDKVVLVAKDKDIRVGQPYVKGAKVTAEVIDHVKGKKVTTLKYLSTKDSSRKSGNRAKLTALNITKIDA